MSVVRSQTRANQSSPKAKTVHYNELNEVQIGLLRMFSRPMTLEQTIKVKRAIVTHLSNELDIEVEKVVADKEITEDDFSKLRKNHQRTAN